MRQVLILLFLLFILAFAAPAEAAGCSVDTPDVWRSKLPCSERAQHLIERIGLCAHFAGEAPQDPARRQFLTDAMKEYGCKRLACDFRTIEGGSSRTAVQNFIVQKFGSVKAFDRGQKYSIKSCKKE